MFTSPSVLKSLGPSTPQKKSYSKTLPPALSQVLPPKTVVSTRKLTKDVLLTFATPPSPLPSLPPTFPLTVSLSSTQHPSLAALSLLPGSLRGLGSVTVLNRGVERFLKNGAKKAYAGGISRVLPSDSSTSFRFTSIVTADGALVATGLEEGGGDVEVLECVGDRMWTEFMGRREGEAVVELGRGDGGEDGGEGDGEGDGEEYDGEGEEGGVTTKADEGEGGGAAFSSASSAPAETAPAPPPCLLPSSASASLSSLSLLPPPEPPNEIDVDALFFSSFCLSLLLSKPSLPAPWNSLYASLLSQAPSLLPPSASPPSVKQSTHKSPKGLLQHLSSLSLLTFSEPSPGNLSVLTVNFSHPDLLAFKRQNKPLVEQLKQDRSSLAVASSHPWEVPPTKLVSLFKIPAAITAALQIPSTVDLSSSAKSEARRGTGWLTVTEIRTAVSDYLNREGLLTSGVVQLDPHLTALFFSQTKKEKARDPK